jgi:hypothetical protein
MDFQLATIAGAGIHLADGQASSKSLPDRLLQLCANDGYIRLHLVWKRLRHNAGTEYLMENP